MATINISPEEFADIVVLFLADKSVNLKKIISNNERFNELMGKSTITKSNLLKYYLDTDYMNRVLYKRIRQAFDGSSSSTDQIRITPSTETAKEEKEKKDGVVKKLIKKIVKKENININKEEEKILNEFFELKEDE